MCGQEMKGRESVEGEERERALHRNECENEELNERVGMMMTARERGEIKVTGAGSVRRGAVGRAVGRHCTELLKDRFPRFRELALKRYQPRVAFNLFCVTWGRLGQLSSAPYYTTKAIYSLTSSLLYN